MVKIDKSVVDFQNEKGKRLGFRPKIDDASYRLDDKTSVLRH